MSAIGSMLALPHAWLATAGAVLAAILVALGTLDGAGILSAKRWLDRLAVALFGLMLGAVLLGPGIVIGVGGPSDPLHFLYAAIAVGAVPVLRLVAVRRGSRRLGWWVAAGGIVTLLALLRLWATGS